MHSELDPLNPVPPAQPQTAVEAAQDKAADTKSKPAVKNSETASADKPKGGIDSMGLPRSGKSSGR